MLTLYDFGNSVCCQKVRITLREKRQEWDAIRVVLANEYDSPMEKGSRELPVVQEELAL